MAFETASRLFLRQGAPEPANVCNAHRAPRPSHALPKPATEGSRAMEIVQDKAHRSLRMNAYSPYAEFAGEEQRSIARFTRARPEPADERVPNSQARSNAVLRDLHVRGELVIDQLAQ